MSYHDVLHMNWTVVHWSPTESGWFSLLCSTTTVVWSNHSRIYILYLLSSPSIICLIGFYIKEHACLPCYSSAISPEPDNRNDWPGQTAMTTKSTEWPCNLYMAKRYTQQYCNHTWNSLKETLPSAFDSISLQTIRKYALRSKRFMDCYRKELEGQQAEFAIKKYKSHRTVPETIFE